MSRLALALAALALLVALYAALRPGAAAPPGELAYHMAYLQRYADKLHAAGAARNWPLAAFYLHEIEETGEQVAGGGYVEDGVALAPLVETVLLPAVERAERAVGDPAAFAEAYGGLVAACNGCHAASAHAFVRIIVPDRSAYPNQAYAPAGGPEAPPVRSDSAGTPPGGGGQDAP